MKRKTWTSGKLKREIASLLMVIGFAGGVGLLPNPTEAQELNVEVVGEFRERRLARSTVVEVVASNVNLRQFADRTGLSEELLEWIENGANEDNVPDGLQGFTINDTEVVGLVRRNDVVGKLVATLSGWHIVRIIGGDGQDEYRLISAGTQYTTVVEDNVETFVVLMPEEVLEKYVESDPTFPSEAVQVGTNERGIPVAYDAEGEEFAIFANDRWLEFEGASIEYIENLASTQPELALTVIERKLLNGLSLSELNSLLDSPAGQLLHANNSKIFDSLEQMKQNVLEYAKIDMNVSIENGVVVTRESITGNMYVFVSGGWVFSTGAVQPPRFEKVPIEGDRNYPGGEPQAIQFSLAELWERFGFPSNAMPADRMLPVIVYMDEGEIIGGFFAWRKQTSVTTPTGIQALTLAALSMTIKREHSEIFWYEPDDDFLTPDEIREFLFAQSESGNYLRISHQDGPATESHIEGLRAAADLLDQLPDKLLRYFAVVQNRGIEIVVGPFAGGYYEPNSRTIFIKEHYFVAAGNGEVGAAFLLSVLAHELIHYEQLTGSREASCGPTVNPEYQSYTIQAQILKALGYDMDATRIFYRVVNGDYPSCTDDGFW